MTVSHCCLSFSTVFTQCDHFFNCLWSGLAVFRGHDGVNVKEKPRSRFYPCTNLLLNLTVELSCVKRNEEMTEGTNVSLDAARRCEGGRSPVQAVAVFFLNHKMYTCTW